MSLTESNHTAPSYSFAHYCEEMDKVEEEKYFNENFSNPEEAFGPHNGCTSTCKGTGWIPINKHNMAQPYRGLWAQADFDCPSEDGYHMVPCPSCQGMHEELDEHIVKQDSKFVLRSKKSNKDLGSYSSKKGAEKREKQVEYFKHVNEDSELPGKDGDQEHKDALKDADDSREADSDKKQKSKERRAQKEKKRQDKKLLPYEFLTQADAEKNATHLGIKGSHTSGNGIWSPGSSENVLRDAVYKKKAKQKASGKFRTEEIIRTVKKVLKG